MKRPIPVRSILGGLSQFSRRDGRCDVNWLDRRENGTVPLASREGDRSMFSADRLSAKCVFSPKNGPVPGLNPAGFTLIEILVATTLSLILLGAVITMFGNVSNSISDSRGMLESADRLRLAEERLQMDLAGHTATPNPPRKPENNEGYLEIIEGPATATSNIAVNTDSGNVVDTTVGDFDDILMLTTRSSGRPFVGKYYNPTTHQNTVIQSDVAEVAWVLRGRTLHRRVLLVKPGVNLGGVSDTYFYANYDVSARKQGNVMVANTLGDLTRRECRFAHAGSAPYDVRDWHWTVGSSTKQYPTLPTLNECSHTGWSTEKTAIGTVALSALDFWTNDSTYRVADNKMNSGSDGTRPSDDIILTNVIGFDVKVWDPTANGNQGDYVDLGTGNGSAFNHFGDPRSQLAGNANMSRTYDTWSTTYFGNTWADGLDDGGATSGNGIVDDDAEKTYPPPYPVPLRGIQVKIRVFEPDSKQVREVTVVQDFLPQ